MVKRMWPALGLVGALLLAAASLHAEETTDLAVASARAGRAAQLSQAPSLPPVAGPALPGDDDTPNRSGSGRQPTDTRLCGSSAPGTRTPGGKLYSVLVLCSQRGVVSLVFIR